MSQQALSGQGFKFVQLLGGMPAGGTVPGTFFCII